MCIWLCVFMYMSDINMNNYVFYLLDGCFEYLIIYFIIIILNKIWNMGTTEIRNFCFVVVNPTICNSP